MDAIDELKDERKRLLEYIASAVSNIQTRVQYTQEASQIDLEKRDAQKRLDEARQKVDALSRT
jgi:hypothetical protein